MKSLEELMYLTNHNTKTVAIYTDSKVTLASLRNNSIHSPLTEDTRNKVRQLTTQNWSIHLGWVKAHNGIEGNALADKLSKAAAEDDGELNILYNRIPITTIATELKKEGITKWQTQWESTDKGALYRSFFPTSEQRLKLKMSITSEFTAIASGHGKTKSYLHRFKLIDNSMCPCDEGAQSSEHLIYDCKILEFQTNILKHQIKSSGGTWLTTNSHLIAKYSHTFSRFIKSVDFNKPQ